MANKNPWKARLTRWRKLWPRPIAELQAQAYSVLMLSYEDLGVDDPEQRRKNILAYFQGLASFAKLHEATELEARLIAIEAALARQEALRATNGAHRSEV